VNGDSHQGSLHHGALLKRAIQIPSLEALEPRPQADVSRGRVLRLQAAHALQAFGNRAVDALQQHLAGQHCSIELPPGQHLEV
jgi:hypothetical protein